METGRYKRNNEGNTEDPRICKHCESGEMEDECHFITKCSFYQAERVKLISLLSKMCPNVQNLQNDYKSLFIYLMTAEGEASCAVGKYVLENFPKALVL